MAQVGSHQQATFTIPINGTSPVDADEVRLNDNAMATSYNAHDADATLHVQSSALALRPSAGTAGRLWFVTDDQQLYYDTGTTWVTLKLDASSLTSGTVPSARVTGSYTGITQTGTLGSLTVTGTTTSGAFSGPLTGNVTGNLTGNVSGNVTGNVTGDVTGNVSGTAGKLNSARTFAVSGDISGSASSDLTSGVTISTTYASTVPIAKGGTNLTATPTNGQLPIGNGTGYTLATLTGGTNISITNAAGAVTINATGTASGVSGTGTTNTVPRWVSGTQIGDSAVIDNGTTVTLGRSQLQLNTVTYTVPSSQGAANTVLQNNGSGVLSWATSAQPLDQQTFDSSSTWTKPSQGSMALIEVWGAGGSGSNSSTANFRNGGAGGGYMYRFIKLSDLAATETVTVGAGGTSRTIAANGITGGNSSFGSWVTGYGGAGGSATAASLLCLGGSPRRAGTTAAWAAGTVLGMDLRDYWASDFAGGMTAPGWNVAAATLTEYASVVFGGAGGACTDNAGNLVAAGTSVFGGNGGATATDGTAPGGGGGRGDNTTGGRSGAGANGRVRVTVW